jgi:hypothetical protein
MEELKTLDLVSMPASETASVIRKSLAEEAKNDTGWVLYYESILAKHKTNIENMNFPNQNKKLMYSIALNRKNAKNKKASKYSSDFLFTNLFTSKSEKEIKYIVTSWGTDVSNVEKSALCFQIRANDILNTYNNSNLCYHPDLTLVEKIGLIVSGELWILANKADNFEQAASLGPGALGSYSNILARSIHAPVESVPLMIDCTSLQKLDDKETVRIASIKKWALNYLSEKDWEEIIKQVVTDLTATSGVESRSYQFGLKLASYL